VYHLEGGIINYANTVQRGRAAQQHGKKPVFDDRLERGSLMK
jgi:predicted sulfurtransferase